MPRKTRLALARELLHSVFGFNDFRPGQEEVVRSVLDGHPTLAVMPTGAGKSLCYQLPALVLPGTTVVVSPLISLMKDQVDKLDELGVEARQVNSALTAREHDEAIGHIEQERSDFVLTTPERLTNPEFIDSLKKNTIDLFVIDEAHCISQWGHDFRPAYLELRRALETLGRPNVLALTATATSAVVEDIGKHLGVDNFHVFNHGVYRSNLSYAVVHTDGDDEREAALVAFLRAHQGAGIVYTATVKAVEALYERLTSIGLSVGRYHGRMSASTRKESQDRFMAGDTDTMVATNAFGMGIDKPDIRYILHYQMPGSLEAYYQESGRAGRDGEHAECVLFYRRSDRTLQAFFMAGRYPRFEDVTAVYSALEACSPNETRPNLAAIREAVPALAASKVRVVLNLMKSMEVVKEVKGARFMLARPHLSGEALQAVARDYEERTEADRLKLERMVVYAQTALCRWKVLLEYFGWHVEWDQCGHCDNCLRPMAVVQQPRSSEADALQAAAHAAQTEGASGTGRPKSLRPGDFVQVRPHGKGQVVQLDGDNVDVRFASGDVRRFKRRYLRRAL